MKKIINILYFILIIFLFYFTKGNNMFLLTMSFSLYLIFNSLFCTIKIEKFKNKNILNYYIIILSIIFLILLLISYLLGFFIDIRGIKLVNVSMCIYLYTNLIIKLEMGYYNKNINIYRLINIFLVLICIVLLYRVFDFDNYINISILYLINIINFIFYNIMFSIFNRKTNKVENKINYIKEIKNIIISDKVITIFNITKSSYLYFSIIILYYILINKYNYSYDVVGEYITYIYLYGISIIYFIYKIINNIYINSFNELKSKIINKEEYNIYNFINKIINISLSLTILLVIISKPLNNLLFNGSNINIILSVCYILLFYVLFDVILNINIICNKNKIIFITLLTGLFISLVFSIPIIDATYRMGYNLVSGSLFSIILGLIISIILGIIFIKNKLKLSLLDNFNNILNIIYSNIIYSLVLVLFTFIIKVDINSIIKSIFVILFYLIITIIFYILKLKLIKKRVQ